MNSCTSFSWNSIRFTLINNILLCFRWCCLMGIILVHTWWIDLRIDQSINLGIYQYSATGRFLSNHHHQTPKEGEEKNLLLCQWWGMINWTNGNQQCLTSTLYRLKLVGVCVCSMLWKQTSYTARKREVRCRMLKFISLFFSTNSPDPSSVKKQHFGADFCFAFFHFLSRSVFYIHNLMSSLTRYNEYNLCVCVYLCVYLRCISTNSRVNFLFEMIAREHKTVLSIQF